jgi:hypothetical protein
VNLEPFPFALTAAGPRAEALRYARKSLDITRRPAVGWHGASQTALEYTVRNKGERNISHLVLRFENRRGHRPSKIQVKLRGPFSPGTTTKRVAEVPTTVLRSYFERTGDIKASHISGAMF